LHSDRFVRPAQKQQEMELADLVIGPSTFVARTIQPFYDKPFALAPYGVDSEFWRPGTENRSNRLLRFIYAGQASIRKGTPFLLKAWQAADLPNAELVLIGNWQLKDSKRGQLPSNVKYLRPCSAGELRTHYQLADVFVFPSYFEGFGLVLLEAMACGLPVISSECTAAPDILTAESGLVAPAGDLDAWIDALRSMNEKRDRLPIMGKAARQIAVENSWDHYRQSLSAAVRTMVS
jgi:starch synthase